MNKALPILFIASLALAGCGGSASDYQSLVDEYKDVMCIGMDPNATMTAKTEALSRQIALNEEYLKAINSLGLKEKQALMMAWAKAVAEVADGNCP